jgi:cytochrome c-type biogenesis protein CcmF
MENLGSLSLLLAFCLAIYAIPASLTGLYRNNRFLLVSGQRAVYGVFLMELLAVGVLVNALMTSDFRYWYVASHSNQTMPPLYKFTAWWGGQEGSLLLWSFILAAYAATVVFTNRNQHRSIMPWVTTALMVTQIFFLTLNVFVVSPFGMVGNGRGITGVPDGQGLNPLLQHWGMAIHPPMLYLGYVGSIVPFAFALGSLIRREPGEAWIQTTRRWTLITWLFQTIGITLGAGWAYYVLGWGGYWGWDPVENASLLPWLTATAFLHSVLMQEKKDMMKVWNMVLVSSTFFLSIFGTMLTRSGLVSSVHAFAQSPIGNWFGVFLGLGITTVIWLIIDRLKYLKSESPLESVVSRESSFLFNNLFLLASCFAVLWGTLFPVISEYVTGEKISVDAPFFNKVNVPIGLVLLFLTGVGPLLAWRRSSVDSLKRNFLWPAVGMGITMALLLATGMRHFYALVSFGLCTFVTLTIIFEFAKGSLALMRKEKFGIFGSIFELTWRNTRRYGGYAVHMGIVVMFIGFTGAAFNQTGVFDVKIGETFQIGNYSLKITEVEDGKTDDYIYQKAHMDVKKRGESLSGQPPTYIRSGHSPSPA